MEETYEKKIRFCMMNILAIANYVGTTTWQLPIYHYDDFEDWEVMQYYDIPSRYEIPDNAESITSEGE